jgi:nucleoside-diphosphate-sugar epimerase
VLITGGAGFLGINLTRHLLRREDEVVTLDLLPFDYPDCRDRITEIQGDIRNTDTVKQAMAGAEVVVHTAAALPLYSKEDIYSTDIVGTRNVIDAAFNAGVERFVHISSTAVYGIPDHHPLLEDDKLIGVGPYGEAKIEAERICEEYRARGMCVTIIRPKSFIGPERLGVFAIFYDWANSGHGFPILGNGKNRYQFLDVEDLCDAITLAQTGGRDAVNTVFNIGAERYTTFREDMQAVLDYAGYGKKIRTLPLVAPFVWTLRLLEALKLSPLYKWVYETAYKDSFVSIDRAKSVLGFQPKFSNKESLIRNYQWYVANLRAFEHQEGVTHRVPWKQGALRFAKLLF